jgi:hypothetical protein
MASPHESVSSSGASVTSSRQCHHTPVQPELDLSWYYLSAVSLASSASKCSSTDGLGKVCHGPGAGAWMPPFAYQPDPDGRMPSTTRHERQQTCGLGGADHGMGDTM